MFADLHLKTKKELAENMIFAISTHNAGVSRKDELQLSNVTIYS